MDLGYLVCSTLRCETEPFSSAVVDDTHQFPPSITGSSASEVSSQSGQFSSSLTPFRKKLQAGYTSPSSLALTRRPREAPLYQKLQSPSTDSTAASTDNSSAASFSVRRSNMAIGRSITPINKNSPRKPSSATFEKRLKDKASAASQDNDFPEVDLPKFCLEPSPLRSKAWGEPNAGEYQVRSKNYMNDRIKAPSEKSAFRLLTVDLVNSRNPIYTGMCAHPGERIQQALERERKSGVRELPEFVFAVNLCIPAETIYHAVFYYGIDKATMDEIKEDQTAFGRVMKKFIFGDSDEYRNQTFKLIPRIVEGNYMVRKGVGTKPAILGKKIKQCYVLGGGTSKTDPRYFEIIVDIASDAVAKRITKLCLGFCTSIVVEMMFAVEGNDESTLPERIFGGAALKNIDFANFDGKRCVK